MAKRVKLDDRYEGLHHWRMKREPAERVFAEEWQALDNGPMGLSGKHLEYLLCVGDQRQLDPVSERDRQVAATVIQWLGSPVGLSWLEETLKKAKVAK